MFYLYLILSFEDEQVYTGHNYLTINHDKTSMDFQFVKNSQVEKGE